MKFREHRIGGAVATAALGIASLTSFTAGHGEMYSSHRPATVERHEATREVPYQSAGESAAQYSVGQRDIPTVDGGPINAVIYKGVDQTAPICSLRSYCTAPMGLADEGTHPFSTSALMGNANVTQLDAQPFTQTVGGQEGAPPSWALNGATLQLNSFLAINTNSGTSYFWIQNYAEFLSSNTDFIVGAEIWNPSQSGSGGASAVFTSPSCNGSSSVTLVSGGGCEAGNLTYSLPLGVSLLTSVQASGNQATISFGYHLGKPAADLGTEPQETQYDQIVITMPTGINSADFVVQHGQNTGTWGVEFVWGGYGGGLGAHFSEMNADMNLYFKGRGICCFRNELPAFDQVIGAEDDATSTAEATDNLSVAPSATGTGITVTVGTPNPGQMLLYYLPQALRK